MSFGRFHVLPYGVRVLQEPRKRPEVLVIYSAITRIAALGFLKPPFPACPIFIAVFFDKGNEPPNKAPHVRLSESLAVGVDHSAMSQARG